MRKNAVGALFLAVILLFAPHHSKAQATTESARKVLARTPVIYPPVARSMMIRGSVKVEAQVAANGMVKSVEVRGGHPILAQSAKAAVQQWRFEPASHETRELIEMKFNPDGM